MASDIAVEVTHVLNGGVRHFTFPNEKVKYDSTGTHEVGRKIVSIYRDGSVGLSGRFNNSEIAALVEAVVEVMSK